MALKDFLPILFGLTMTIVLSAAARAEPVSLVGFGDSLMAGYQLPPEDAFPARLEKALKEKGIDVTIANAGVSGDTTSSGLARIDWSIPEGTTASSSNSAPTTRCAASLRRRRARIWRRWSHGSRSAASPSCSRE